MMVNKRTKVICTIGPASSSVETLKEMILNGMNIARFNMSHGNYDFHKNLMKQVRLASSELGVRIGMLLDTKGPEVRIGSFKNGKVTLKEGQAFTLTTHVVKGDTTRCTCNYANIHSDLNPGDTIYANDGLLQFQVTSIRGHDVITKVIKGGNLSDQKALNFPSVKLSLPYMSTQDRNDIIFGIKSNVDFVAASFVSTAENVMEVRKLLDANKGNHIRIIAKIENQEGVDNIESILEVADGIMVARGDMGVEINFENLPTIQKDLIDVARKRGKVAIVATEMLESMIENPRPTRAEVSDVANAVFDGACAVMLSGETAAGKYPAKCVFTMAKVCAKTEERVDFREWLVNADINMPKSPADAISRATVEAAINLKAKLIIAFTQSGFTARMVSRYRPSMPVVACTDDLHTASQLSIIWGVHSHPVKTGMNVEKMQDIAQDLAYRLGHKAGDIIAVIFGNALVMKLIELP